MKQGWRLVPLREVLTPIERAEQPLQGVKYRQLGVQLWGKGAYERESIDGGSTRYKTLNRVATNDVVVNKIWARNGSVAVVRPELDGCFVSGEFPLYTIRPEMMHPDWMHWMTKTRYFWNMCDEKSQGTSGKNRIKPEKFLDIEIPLPPLDEQRRIVARIEKFEEWVTSAQQLHHQIKNEVNMMMNNLLAEIFDNIQPRVLLKTVCETTSGGTPNRDRIDYYNGTIPWIKSGELEDTIIARAEENITELAVAESSAKIFPSGTLLVAMYGATIGKTGVLQMDAATNQAICAIFPSKDVNRDYLWWFLRRMRPSFLEMGFGGAQPNISQRVLRETEFPLPPLPEQRKIVERLNHTQQLYEEVVNHQLSTTSKLNALIPSILDKAFKGEL